MAKFGKTVLVAGLLAASANAAFADNRPHKQPHPQNAATQQAQATPISGITKDGHMVRLEINVPTLNKGNYSDVQFASALQGGLMMASMQAFTPYAEADIPKNIDKIQKEITAHLGAGIPLGTVTNGKPDFAKPGVNFGTATITRVTDMISNKVIYERAAPTSKPAAPKAGA